MSTVYIQNDILLCGSTRESYPNAISKALADGLAVISTPVAGVPDVIEDGINGYLSKGYSAEDIFERSCTRGTISEAEGLPEYLTMRETFLDNHSWSE